MNKDTFLRKNDFPLKRYRIIVISKLTYLVQGEGLKFYLFSEYIKKKVELHVLHSLDSNQYIYSKESY